MKPTPTSPENPERGQVLGPSQGKTLVRQARSSPYTSAMGPRHGDGGKDLDLVRRVLRGETSARSAFVERMGCLAPFIQVLHVRLGSPLPAADLADIVQDTLVLIWCKLPGFEGRARLETWAYRFCQLELMNRVRRHSADQDLQQTADLNKLPGHNREGQSKRWLQLDAALRQLPEQQEEVLRLKHLEGLTFEEIGAQHGISTSKAKRLHYGALGQLKRIMDRGEWEGAR